MSTASESDEDCAPRWEVEACGEEACSVGEERLRKACEGAEAMMSRLAGECQDGSYCIVLWRFD